MSYLNKELAVYYTKAYEHSKDCIDDVWKLNSDIEPYLNRINDSDYVRTLYSRDDRASGNLDKNSYLAFCYSEKVENYIETVIIPQLKSEFNNEEIILKFRKTEPVITRQVQLTNLDLKYVTDKSYRNIWLYHVLIRGNFDNKHFWEFITTELTNIEL